MDERVNPMLLTYKGVEYKLDFTRETVRNAERAGLKLADVTDFPTTKIPELFWGHRPITGTWPGTRPTPSWRPWAA